MTVIKGLAEGREVELPRPAAADPVGARRPLPIWMAAYGPKALELTGEQADGFILQIADPDIAAWTIGAVRAAAAAAGRDPAVDHDLRRRARPTSATDLAAPARTSALVRRHGRQPRRRPRGRYGTDGPVPAALTDYIAGRQGYDYAHHGKAGNPSTDFVPDEIVDRFCLLGPAARTSTGSASWPRSASTSSPCT